jgi:hypothetical protein
MKKFVIFTLVGVAVIGVLVAVIAYVQLQKTKSFSPEQQESYEQNGLKINVFYNRPFKKDRVIFGGLVPYDKVWRTGANEATTFETNKDLRIGDKVLKAGKYSVWAIPRPETWTIIFNSEYGQWGINSKGEANRQPERDVLTVDINAVEQDQVFEQFTISLEKSGDDLEMVFAWDKTVASLQISL